MSFQEPLEEASSETGVDPVAALWIMVAMLGVAVGGFVAFRVLQKPIGPPPADMANDALLVEGRAIYLARCATCHGADGRGDGPIARDLAGPPVGNLADKEWKHGDRPEQVVGVIAQGVPGTRMTGWSSVLDPPELKAAAAFVYYLAGRAVPADLRKR